MKKVVRRVRSRVSKNKRRLSRCLRRINAPPFLSPRPYDSLRRTIVRYGSLAESANRSFVSAGWMSEKCR